MLHARFMLISVLRAAPRNVSFSTGLRVLVGVTNMICPSPIGATRTAYRALPMPTSEM